MAFDPAQGPVDRHLSAGAFHRGDHPPRVIGAGGKGFLHEDMTAMGGEPFGIGRVIGGRRAQDRHVIGARGHAGVEIGEKPRLWHAEGLRRRPHLCRVRVVKRRDLGLGVVVNKPQQIAHMHMVKADAGDAKRGHESLPSVGR